MTEKARATLRKSFIKALFKMGSGFFTLDEWNTIFRLVAMFFAQTYERETGKSLGNIDAGGVQSYMMTIPRNLPSSLTRIPEWKELDDANPCR